MLKKLNFFWFVLILNHGIGGIVAQESLGFGEKGDSGLVININCGGPSQGDGTGDDMPRNPGKIGPVGPVGPKGSKGEAGSCGNKGEAEWEPDVEEIKSDILGMLSATSCSELISKYGVNKTGYYLMRNGNKAAYNYCDFNDYEGTTSCDDLESRHGVSTTGYYWMSVRGVESPDFVFCDFYVYTEASTCEQLRSNRGRLLPGYYRIHGGGNETSSFVYCGFHTCKQLQDFNGTTTSGVYSMSLGDNPYEVRCNFASGAAITEVWHSSMEEVKASPECEDAGCYVWIPQYDLPRKDILKIIENSQRCRQFIKVRCQGMFLLSTSDIRGWWVSRQGEKMLYWGGATSRRDGYCACGETGSCLDNSFKCNCDQNSNDLVTADEGFITDKSKLPVREIRLGDMNGSNERGWHTLGKLECME